jgi:1-acyl-sn-glycerol-3-phosphate acyltransferase
VPARHRRRWAAFWRLAIFWICFARETVGRRRLMPLARRRLGSARAIPVVGLSCLPTSGSFVLAANHNKARRALDVIASVLSAANQARPELANRYLLVSGQRRRDTRDLPRLGRLARAVVDWVFRRWRRHVVRIPLGNSRASIAALRQWRLRAHRQPCLVFPEGRGQGEFGAVRPGSGRWLAMLGVPVVPVAVWWEGEQSRVRFGAPIMWAGRTELHDAQVGLAIAGLLPSALAPAWQPALVRWRTAHGNQWGVKNESSIWVDRQ